jgi:hypothetical protein
VRLEDWQKFIETQFLDDEPLSPPDEPEREPQPERTPPYDPEIATEPITVEESAPGIRKSEGFVTSTVQTETAVAEIWDSIPQHGTVGPVDETPAFLTDSTHSHHTPVPLPLDPSSAPPIAAPGATSAVPYAVESDDTFDEASAPPIDMPCATVEPIALPLPPEPPQIRFEVIAGTVEPVAKRIRRANRQQSLQIFPILREPIAEQEPPTRINGATVPEPLGRKSPPTTGGSNPILSTIGAPPDLDAQIPAFEGYLPASHPASSAPSIMPATSQPPAPQPPLPEINHAVIGNGSSIAVSDAATVAPKSDDHRNPKRGRAPTALNLRTEPAESISTTGELWAQVPHHVQTLLALSRIEEETETAQSSYKRPFEETRRELIQRLLDPILSMEEAARLLNVCPATVRRYTNRGLLTCYRKEPDRVRTPDMVVTDKETRQRRFRLSAILAFLEAQHAAIEADRLAERPDLAAGQEGATAIEDVTAAADTDIRPEPPTPTV